MRDLPSLDEGANEPGGSMRSAELAVPRIRARALLERDWDAIVIGAGVGGLVAAALLSTRAGLRVLVLERHYEPGGLTQTFQRRHDTFEVGVHYVGEVGHRRRPLRRLFDTLTEGRLAWSAFGDVHDRIRIEDREVRFGPGIDRVKAELARFAPREEHAIDRYLADVQECARRAPFHLLARAGRGGLAASAPSRLDRFIDVTTAEHLASLGASDRLAGLLTACFGNYGSPPDRSSFAAHAVATAHYFDGAFYPVGGGGRIARELMATIVKRGSAIVVRARVGEILVDDGRARGVRLDDGTELLAKIVVSDAGAATTYTALLGEDDRGVGEMRESLARVGPSIAHCGLYLGLRGAPSELGLDGSNLWRIAVEPARSLDATAAWVRGERSAPPLFFLSSPCANDPTWSARRPGRSSLVASLVLPFEGFERWVGTRRNHRGEDYDALKARLTKEALAFVLAEVPELRDAVDHVEMSSPLTTHGFTGHPRGETCGLDHSPLRFRLACTPHTPIAGLAIAGQDAWLCGVGGAAWGGLSAASAILGRDLAREIVFG